MKISQKSLTPKQLERKQRDAEIIRLYASFMRRRIPDKRVAVRNLGPAFDVSEGTISAVIKREQSSCHHKPFHPYPQFDPEVVVCELCWKEQVKA